MSDEEVLTPDQVAELLGFEGKHPAKMVYRLPLAQIRISPRVVRYLKSDVMEFLRRRRYGGTQVAR